MLSDFRQMLKNKTIAQTLSEQAYDDLAGLGFDSTLASEVTQPLRIVVENERAFAVRHGGQLLNGSIDRIVWLYAGKRLVAADVIDFKTDRVESEQTLAGKAAFYGPQLQAYRAAVCRMSGLAERQVLTRLLFVGDGKLVSVE
jgi:ATP-dependent exoDNAse (exonuclease V) beta subunit